MSKLIFEKSVKGARAFTLPESGIPPAMVTEEIPADLLREEDPLLPEISEVEAVRHFTELSQKSYGVDSGFYPLGSCTMKYNPKINEWAARLPGFAGIHPYQPEETVQGALELMYELEQMLCEITGMDSFTLQPAAGAHGEMTGAMIIKAYHNSRGDTKRTKMIVPDSAHGTNPATANMLGYKVIEVKSDERGLVDIEDLRALMSDEIAGLMLTNPNTLGLFEENIREIAAIVHDAGGLLYYDGANANAIIGIARPGDMGFDICHLNLHKTFGTPHGGGGPGSGPIGVKSFLADFLPVPVIEKHGGKYHLNYNRPLSIGKVHTFYGNFGVMVKAYTYIKALGSSGLKAVSQNAVLNANYLRTKLAGRYDIPYNRLCKHEFVASARKQKKEAGITALDVAKALIDRRCHPPTIYFPLIVEEALMIEPTETETRERLDAFIEAMLEIDREARENPERLKEAPHRAVIRRPDETGAARNPILKWTPKD
ncbi:MAG TPA: aminomethyl-transferring glycine dehydrogenase subunit GcvPB [Syntrophomonadaceae bacterium]|nr:aminomethyl-transferring glycine dehydrogenase subunit GcvPB [Syntrophomonadaceae bacterium]